MLSTLVTLAGIVIDSNESHPSNEYEFIVVKFSGKTTVFNSLQFWNIFVPNCLTPLGITIDSIPDSWNE